MSYEQPLTWESWKAELEQIAWNDPVFRETYGPNGPIGCCGEQCWREFFEAGDSPRDALDEEQSDAD